MTEVLTEAGVNPEMINTQRRPDVDSLRELVWPAVEVAREYLEKRRSEYDAKIAEALEEPRERLDRWRQLSLDVGTSQESVTETVERQRRLLASLHCAGEPLLRVLAILEGAA
jgi:hypothetical protein